MVIGWGIAFEHFEQALKTFCAISAAQNGPGKQCQGTKGSAYLFSFFFPPFVRGLCVNLFRDLDAMHRFSHISMCFTAAVQGNPFCLYLLPSPSP